MPPLRLHLLLLLGALPAFATTPAKTHFDHRRELVAAYQRKDYPAMRAACAAALALRPDSPRYLFNLATAEVLDGQPTAALATLRRLAALGVSLPVEKSPDLAPLRAEPEFDAILAALAANRAPRGSVTPLHAVDAVAGIWEGLAWQKSTGDFLIGDVHRRGIWRLDSAGNLSTFAAPAGILGVFGLALDESRGALWAATSAVPEMTGYRAELQGAADLAEFALADGSLRRLLRVPADGRDHLLGDLTLAPDGTVYLTDSAAPVIWRLAPAGTELEIVCESPAFASLQGLALLNQGQTLLVSDYANGLHTVDLATGDIRSIAPPPDATLLGIDGLVAHGADVFAVQNGIAPSRIVHFRLSADGTTLEHFNVLAAALLGLDDLTLLTLADGQPTVIAGGGWTQFTGSTEPPAPHPSRILQVQRP